MGPGTPSVQSLPSLEILMRETFGSESGLHIHGKHSLGHPSIVDPDRLPSPAAYQLSQESRKQLTMSIPRIPMPPSHTSPVNEPSHASPVLNDTDSHSSLTIPSPISPRTRCPSLTESIFTPGTCSSPTESGPATPISESGSSGQVYSNRHNLQRPNRVYESESNNFCLGKGLPPSSVHRIPHHSSSLHNAQMGIGISPSCHQHNIDADTPMATDHQEEKLTKQEKRRRNHLNSEKRRRENIKGGMDALVELVPSCRNIQESKANILKKTREYVYQLLNGYKEIQMEVKRLKVENAELRRLLALQPPTQHQGQPDNLLYRGRP